VSSASAGSKRRVASAARAKQKHRRIILRDSTNLFSYFIYNKKGRINTMKHAIALGIKFVLIATVLFSVLTVFDTALLSEIAIISLLITVTSYLIGDLFILPRFGNLIATVADFVLITAGIWIISGFFIRVSTYNIFIVSTILAAFIALGEAFVHAYIENRILKKHEATYFDENVTFNRMQTEFAEEQNVYDIKKHDREE
jgi:hypothetical protein